MSKKRTRKPSRASESPPNEKKENMPGSPPIASTAIPPMPILAVDQPFAAKAKNAIIRSFWALIMLGFFVWIIRQGMLCHQIK